MFEDLEGQIAALAGRSGEWAALAPERRAALLRACVQATLRVAPAWVRGVCEAKGIDPDGALAGEAWLSGPMPTVRTLRLAADALAAGAVARPAATRRRADRTIVTVAPMNRLERVSLGGLRAELWLRPGASPTQGGFYRNSDDPRRRGGLALVLGAGNVSAIAAKDLVYKLVVDNEVVLLKMHPVTEHLTPVFEAAFAPLVAAGYLAICRGDAEVGDFLCRHELVTSIHLTGSDRTYDAIVWGSAAEERERRKAANEPRLAKPFSAELGCVTPVIVVPGAWKAQELEHQAASVAGMVTHNASFNCTAAKAVVTARDWSQRQEFLDALRRHLARTSPRRAYYPGARSRYQGFLEAYPDAEVVGVGGPGIVPWTLLPEVPAEHGEYALSHEAFCGVVADVPIPASDAASFLEAAVPFVNESVWGSLSCNVVVDPRTRRQLGPSFEDAVEALHYGGVAVNTWTSVLFGLGSTSWGAYPGNDPRRIGSGTGIVGNTMLFDHPERSVAYGSFRQWPKPPWFGDHRSLDVLGRRWTSLEGRPSWLRMPGFAAAAVRG